MSIKKLEICNRALSLTNQQAIESLEDNTAEAIACNFLYPLIKQEVLSAYAFKGSIRVIILQHIANQISTSFNNLIYKFLLPESCLKVVSVNGEFIKQGHYLYSNLPCITVNYVANIGDSELDISLSYLISLKLALELLHRFSETNLSLITLFRDNYNNELKKLAQQDSLYGSSGVSNISTNSTSWLNCR